MRRYLCSTLFLLLSAAALAAPPSADVTNGTTAKYYAFPYNPPVRDKKARTGPAFDEYGLNRAPLIITDKDGKPLTPNSTVLNRGKDVGCGLERLGDVFRVVACK